MTEYNDKLLLGEHSLLLNDAQREYIEFEKRSLLEKYLQYLDGATSEIQMQYFFESNPILLPGLYDLHNGPVGNVVVSKLQLSSEYVTDFAFISVNSAVAQITLIEIESPNVDMFRNSDDEFTSAFNKSYQQVRDWELWADQNAAHLKDTFRFIYHRNIFKYQKVITRRILIVGRRFYVKQNARREKRWASINQNVSTVVMTYDRLGEISCINARLLQKLLCRPARAVSHTIKSD